MKKKNLRIITLVLSAALLICAFAFTVGAESGNVAKVEGGEEYATFAEALTNVPEGGKITLIGNATMDATYTVTKSFTLDLGGKTLNVTTEGAFVIDEAHDVTITGTGAINLAGNLIRSTTTAGVAYNFTLEGTDKGIDVNHNGKGNGVRIADIKGGTVNVKNVSIVSTSTKEEADKVFFYSYSNAVGATFNIEKVSFFNDGTPSKQNALGFLYLGGGSTATVKDSTIRTGGTPIHAEMNASRDVNNVIANIENSHLEIISKDNDQRSNLVWVGGSNAADTNVKATIYFKGSFLGGNCYRGVHGHKVSANQVHIVFDNSVMANNGANDTKGTGDNDTQFTRGARLIFKNNSAIVSANSIGIAESGVLEVHIGTRFTSLPAAKNTGFQWKNTDGTALDKAKVKFAFDPAGDFKYPVLSTLDSNVGITFADDVKWDFAGMDHGSARSSQSDAGFYVNNVGNTGFKSDYTDFYQGQPKSGALTKYSAQGNTSFKYWISNVVRTATQTGTNSDGKPTYSYSTKEVTLGEEFNFGINECDPWFVFGDSAYYHAVNSSGQVTDTAFAPIKDDEAKGYKRTYVYVVDLDIATDSEYGFPKMIISTTARDASNGNKTSTAYATLQYDGSFANSTLKDFNANVKLSTTEWNHITAVYYTDSSVSKTGTAYIYVNGELLGYSNEAYKDGAAYIQGFRMHAGNNSTNKAGTSFLIDNLLRRAYTSYATETEVDGGTKNPSAYLINIPKNTTPLNKDITANGMEYATLDEAIKAANTIGTYAKLNNNIVKPQVVNTNGNVLTNGYTLGLSNEGYGADVVLDGTTVTEYIFNENYTATTDYVIYTGDPDDNGQKADPKNYRTITVKMGRLPDAGTLTAYLDESAGNYKLADITGWEDKDGGDFALVNLSKAFAEANATVTIYPKTSGAKVIASYVKDSFGKVLLGTTDDNGTNNALKALKDGETIVLCADLNYESSAYFGNKALDSAHGVTLDNDYTDEELAKMKAVAQVIGIDVNGFTVKVFNEATFIFASNNTVVNCYSSKEGGYIYSRAATIRNGNTEYGFYGLRIFGIYNGGKEEGSNAMTVSNAHINVGAYNGMYRNNLTVSGGVLFEGLTGDNSCSINVDGIVGTRSVQDSSAAIITRAYWGKIIIKNSAILNPTGTHIIDLKVADAYKFNGAHPTPYLYIEDSILVNRGGETDPMVSDNSDSTEISIEYKNVIANGRLNPSNEGQDKVKVNEGVGGSNCALGTLNAPAGLKNVNYNVPMDLSKYTGKYIFKVQTPALISKTEGGVNDDIYVYIVTQGYENLVPAGAKSIVLPNIKTITAFSSDIVKVNYADKDGKVEKTVEYKKGGNVNTAEYTAKTLTMNAITLNPTGEWEGETKNLQANVTLTSKYTAKSAVSGLKANLSLYTDFDINLYIPAKYKDYVSVSDGADNIVLVPVTVGGEGYLKAVISRNADEAAVNASYVITVSEAGYTASTTASINITTYAEAILKGSYTDADKQLMMYMLEYANESAKYFGKDNSVIEAILTNEEYQGAKGEGTVDKSYAAAIENIGLSEVFSSASVKLTSAPAFVFTVNGNLTGKVTVEYAGNVKEYTLDGNSEIVIEGMKVYNFTSTLKITAEYQKDGETVTVSGSYNLDTYAKYHTEIASATPTEEITEEMINSSKACLALIEALYDYATVADIYTK